ncbi:MAG: hypothetical protein UX09_C0033G0011 [Candidatus Uhrbacteria bacterium GW2011_GWE2_45_35]|uniref:Uncharacterized protein n=2 Tax=Candidatus Uhriibacteriota TaxID=1752732 RepID=A0A0G1LPU5_9BACT|nr:MAG: hypothetical protein UW63_C0021G0007 [Candidatus Uhrbacteria bacterium GW2011_GWF2_44_350]KKU07218.1 MAG: hypothetical protein UX09_C0033G0011 [Candidatus Uhrbacteria bacterium GW2011_GWE2_45_35]HBR80633.1 hypothetical protein [Candidatus Uhrbacteria bacterium]HCU31566.1 hypothetical protein [Candidatus Uhrbacteria bacterium]
MLDLVIAGPDMSGTSTQINDLISFFQNQNKKVRDLRGTEIDALWQAEVFRNLNEDHLSLKDCLEDEAVPRFIKDDFLKKAVDLLVSGNTNGDLKIASCNRNEVSTYINPDSAEVWIMEEPSKRGSGQVCRTIEQHRSKHGSELDPVSAAHTHSVYRLDEFLRFRRVFREQGKVIIRSRSEESGCYQVQDNEFWPQGIPLEDYLNLPGHKIAFGHPPTHIFVVCASEDWTREQYLELKSARSGGRLIDDHEALADYQVMVNRRYASDWLENFYEHGCKPHGSTPPKIFRFNIYDSKEEIRKQMENTVMALIMP